MADQLRHSATDQLKSTQTPVDVPDIWTTINPAVRSTPVDLTPEALGQLGGPVPDVDGVSIPTRFTAIEHCGESAGFQLFLARDRLLDRQVLIKVLTADGSTDDEQRRRFFLEAGTAGRLRHPCILPIHEIGVSERGHLYLICAHVGSHTLARRIREDRSNDGDSWDPLTAMARVGEAVAFAHEAGIIHRDLKPDHVVCDEQGGALLGGWECMAEVHAVAPAIVGTPLYMAPEQARGQAATRRSDVFALGVMLAYAITGDHPCLDGSPREFWQAKLTGHLDAETWSRRHPAAPPQIMEVALRAMREDPGQRFSDARAFVQALDAAIARMRQPLVVRPQRWPLVVTTCIALAACTALAYQQTRPSAATVQAGQQRVVAVPVHADALPASLGVLRGWVPTADGQLSAFRIADGDVISSGPFHNYLFCRDMLAGPIEVECTATWERGTHPGEFSVVWVPADPFQDGNKAPLAGAVYLQFGGWDHDMSSIFVSGRGKDTSGMRVSIADIQLEQGRPYRLRYRIAEDEYCIEADGQLITSFRDPRPPLRNGWVGIYATREGKRFSGLRITSNRRMEVPLTTGGETLARDGHYDDAAAEFARIERLLTGDDAGEARFRRGAALHAGGHVEEARSCWLGIRDATWGPSATIATIRLDYAAGQHDAVIAGLQSLRSAPPRMQALMQMAWGDILNQIAVEQKRETFDRYLALRRDLFGEDACARKHAAIALLEFKRFAEIVNGYPDAKREAAMSLIALGREEEVLVRYPHRLEEVERAKLNLGQLNAAAQGPFGVPRSIALVLLGRGAEVVDEPGFPGDRHRIRLLAALSIGRTEDLALVAPGGWQKRAVTAMAALAAGDEAAALAKATVPNPDFALGLGVRMLLRAGRVVEARANWPAYDAPDRRQVTMVEAVLAARRGDAGELARLRAVLAESNPDTSIEVPGWMAEFVLLPLASQLLGEAGAMEHAREVVANHYRQRWAGQAWLALARATTPSGEVDGVCIPLFKPAFDMVIAAVRCELAGDRQGARASWRAYLQLPFAQRLWGDITGDPALDLFATWRAEAP